MKLIIQIPCYNEADTLPLLLSELPRQLAGVDQVEWLVVDDGSSDATADVARAHGVDHLVVLPRHLGLSRAFIAGLEACLCRGADIIVNTDADNQYQSVDIPALVEPVLAGRADMVVGARPISAIDSFSPAKKFLQRLGSSVVRMVSRTDIPDAPSGFRALSREAALKLNVFNDYTYTLETIIQAGQKGLVVTSVPVRVNPELRPSRLVKSVPVYVGKSMLTIVRIFILYRPFRFFMAVGMSLFATGFLIGLRFLAYYFADDGDGHVQSLILASILLGVGFQVMLAAFLADIIAVNRRLLEETQLRLKRQALSPSQKADDVRMPPEGYR